MKPSWMTFNDAMIVSQSFYIYLKKLSALLQDRWRRARRTSRRVGDATRQISHNRNMRLTERVTTSRNVRDASSQRPRSRKSRLTKWHAISYDVQDAVREPLNGNTKFTKRNATSRPILYAIKLRSRYRNMKAHDAGCNFKQCPRFTTRRSQSRKMRAHYAICNFK
jgi:hypothetical protein